jgi:hypothetical protein
MQTRSLRVLALAIALGIPSVQPSTVRAVQQDHQVRGYLGTLANGRGSTTDEGRVVLTLEAAGDLRGLITVTLSRGADDTLSGTWAMTVAYVQDLTADGSIALDVPHMEPHEDHAEHREYMKFMRDGSLQGTISGAALRFDERGRPCGLDRAELLVSAGSVKYAGARGNGSITFSTGPDGGAATNYSFTF